MYIQNGYEVKNALIENADITTEEYPTVNILKAQYNHHTNQRG